MTSCIGTIQQIVQGLVAFTCVVILLLSVYSPAPKHNQDGNRLSTVHVIRQNSQIDQIDQEIDQEIAKVKAKISEVGKLQESPFSLYRIRRTKENKTGIVQLYSPIIVEKAFQKNCSHKSFPKAIIIGVSKCGTGALRYFLERHPQVAMEVLHNGVKYFIDGYFEKGEIWYRQMMPCSTKDQITIEQTPHYFLDPNVPKRMYDFNKNVKLLIILRDPADRVVSQLLQMNYSRRHYIHGRFEDMVYDYSSGKVKSDSPIIWKSMYALIIKRWLEFFPLSQFHFVDSARFKEDPVSELKKLENFLELDDYFKPEHFPYVEEKGFHCIQTIRGVRCLSNQKARPHSVFDPNVLAVLKDFYEPYNEILYKMIGQRFDWGVE